MTLGMGMSTSIMRLTSPGRYVSGDADVNDSGHDSGQVARYKKVTVERR